MPEGYTHVRTGLRALKKSGIKADDSSAFGAGANGPDPFFFYRIWDRKRTPDLPGLGSRMHKQRTGSFLLYLVEQAQTAAQKSYVLGFLTHYATDKAAHPYVAFLTTGENAPYGMPCGHGFYETGLDSALYRRDYRATMVAVSVSTPLPQAVELEEIARLLQGAIAAIYNEDIPNEPIKDSFAHIRLVRRCLRSRFGVRRVFFRLVERLVFRSPGYVLSHVAPGNPPQRMPSFWENPFENNKRYAGGIDEILIAATKESVRLMQAANQYWCGFATLEECRQVIGNKNYETGQEQDD